MTPDDWWWVRALLVIGVMWYLTNWIAGPMTDFYEALTP